MATRSLGALTIDLIAKTQGFVQGWTQAERQADRAQKKIAADAKKNAKEIEDAWRASAEKVGSAWTAVLGVIGGAVTVSAITNTAKETANLAVEFDKLSQLSGLTNQAFQKYAAGASTVGISSEKLADIFKDVQDKAGEFAQTGGGGMKDFFEKIAPKIGVTIDQFRRLSGPEALQLYVNSLEKSKLSHQDMVFYMEAMANDSAMLLPLLKDNGKEWERLGKAAEDAGAIMGDRALQAARDYKTESENLERVLKGLRIEVMEQVLPAITQFTALLSSEATRSSFASIIGWIGQTAAAAVSMAATIAQSSPWGWLQIGAEDSKDLGKSITETERKIASLQGTVESMSRPLHRIINADDIITANGQISTLQSKLKALYAARNQQEARDKAGRRSLGLDLGLGSIDTLAAAGQKPTQLSPATPPKASGGKSQAEKDYEAAEKYIKAIDAQAAGRKKMTAYEQLSYDLSVGKVKMTEKQMGLAEGAATAVDMAKEAEELRGNAVARNTALYEAQERILAKTAEYEQLLATYGMGDKQAANLRERVSLLQAQQTELRKMAQDQATAIGAAKDDGEVERLKARYEDRLAIIKDAQAQELQLYDENVQKKKELDGNWLLGAQASIQTYIEKTQDSYALARDATTSMMSTIDNAFVNLFTLGESSAKSFFATVLKGIAQIAAQQAASGIAGFLGSAISSLLTGGAGAAAVGSGSILNTGVSFGGFRAAGGSVAGGSLYRVNELGPELLSYGGSDYLMMGGSGGYVKPLGAATTEQRGAGNITVVNQTTGRVDKVEQRQLTRDDVVLIIQEQTPGIMVSQTQNANSAFSRTMQGSFNTTRRR